MDIEAYIEICYFRETFEVLILDYDPVNRSVRTESQLYILKTFIDYPESMSQISQKSIHLIQEMQTTNLVVRL